MFRASKKYPSRDIFPLKSELDVTFSSLQVFLLHHSVNCPALSVDDALILNGWMRNEPPFYVPLPPLQDEDEGITRRGTDENLSRANTVCLHVAVSCFSSVSFR
jgi:hypothetical protein